MYFRLAGGALARLLRGAKQVASSANVSGHVILGAAADEGFMAALDMCGNEGQISIIEMTGWDAFYAGAEEALGGGSAEYALLWACPYPDAVGEILGEAGAIIDDYVATAAGQQYVEGWEGYN